MIRLSGVDVVEACKLQDGQEPDHDVVPDGVDFAAEDVLVDLEELDGVFRLASADELVAGCAAEKVRHLRGGLGRQEGVEAWVSQESSDDGLWCAGCSRCWRGVGTNGVAGEVCRRGYACGHAAGQRGGLGVGFCWGPAGGHAAGQSGRLGAWEQETTGIARGRRGLSCGLGRAAAEAVRLVPPPAGPCWHLVVVTAGVYPTLQVVSGLLL